MRLLFTALALAALPAFAEVPAATPVAEDRATRDDYVVDGAATTTTMKVGTDGLFSVKITPKNGKKVHPDAPLEVALVDSALVKPGKAKLGRGDLKEKGAREPEVTTPLRPVKAGSATLEATVSFFLCTDSWCQRITEKVQLPITVTE